MAALGPALAQPDDLQTDLGLFLLQPVEGIAVETGIVGFIQCEPVGDYDDPAPSYLRRCYERLIWFTGPSLKYTVGRVIQFEGDGTVKVYACRHVCRS